MSATIILGCHRSGTSLVAGLYHNAGVIMGTEFKPAPSEENPLGFFEDWNGRKINDAILEKEGYVVKDWSTTIPKINTDDREQRLVLKHYINQRGQSKQWGFKDPRLCLTWQAWNRMLPINTKYIFVFRHPLSVANSLANRDGISFNTGLDIWYEYNRRALGVLREPHSGIVSYESIINKEYLPVFDYKKLVKYDLNRSLPSGELPRKHASLFTHLKVLERSIGNG